jgi:hypothetical protein
MSNCPVIHLEIPSEMSACPIAWIRFFNEEMDNDDSPKDKNGDITIRYINQKLKKWNGKYVEGKGRRSKILFETSEDFLVFMMRWSS